MSLITAEIAGFVNENTELFHFFCSLKEKAGNFPAKGGPGSDDQPVFLYILYVNLMINQVVLKVFYNQLLAD